MSATWRAGPHQPSKRPRTARSVQWRRTKTRFVLDKHNPLQCSPAVTCHLYTERTSRHLPRSLFVRVTRLRDRVNSDQCAWIARRRHGLLVGQTVSITLIRRKGEDANAEIF